MVGIYKIASPTGKVYIGQSVTLERRAKQYEQGHNTKSQTKLYNSLVKYGFSEHIFEVVEECEVEVLNERERHWQDFYDVVGKNGLNCRLTKTEDKSGYLSTETRLAIGKAHMGKEHSQEAKIRMSKSAQGRIVSEETKNKISNTLKGTKRKPISEEHRQKLVEAKKGIKLTQAHKDALKGPRGQQKTPREKGYTLSEEHRANMKGPRGPQKNPKRNKIKVVK